MEWVYFLVIWIAVPVFFYLCHYVLFYVMETDLASLLTLYAFVLPFYGIAVTVYLFFQFGFNIPNVLSFLITTYLVLSSISENIFVYKSKKMFK